MLGPQLLVICLGFDQGLYGLLSHLYLKGQPCSWCSPTMDKDFPHPVPIRPGSSVCDGWGIHNGILHQGCQELSSRSLVVFRSFLGLDVVPRWNHPLPVGMAAC